MPSVDAKRSTVFVTAEPIYLVGDCSSCGSQHLEGKGLQIYLRPPGATSPSDDYCLRCAKQLLRSLQKTVAELESPKLGTPKKKASAQ